MATKKLDDLMAYLAAIQKRARQWAEQELENATQFPPWPEQVRAVPNGFLWPQEAN